jgi:hypothetical protein
MNRTFFLTITTILFLAINGWAVSLSQYKQSIVTARAYIRDLEDYSKAKGTAAYDPQTEKDIVGSIRKTLPAHTTVEQSGSKIEVMNGWFQTQLDVFESESDTTRRTAILREAADRLDALKLKLDDLEAATASSRSKDEDKQKLAEILRREEYQKPKAAEESLAQRLLRELLEWLESILPRPQNAPTFSGMPNLAYFLQILLYVAIAGLLLFGVYKLAPVLFPKLKRTRSAKRKERVILGEQIGEDVSAQDIFAEAERLAAEGDLRGAIRKGYIALICDLSDKRLIGLARHKTNRDYLRELRSRREIAAEMSGITNNFERSWYGLQAANSSEWQSFRENCERTMRIAEAAS